MKDKMILKDGTVIELEAGAYLGALQVSFAGWSSVAEAMPKLTADNLSKVSIMTSEGLTVGNYTGLIMEPGSYTVREDSVLVTISLREPTALETRMDAVETGQAVQDGAINDLGQVVGEMAEGGMA